MIMREEPFGPIVPTQPWDDEDEVIRRTNDTDTGLGASVFSRDVARAERIARRIQAGSIFINNAPQPDPSSLFAGAKQSGLGGEWGQEGLKGFLCPQVVHVFH